MVDKVGPITIHVPSGEVMTIYEAAERYMGEGKHINSDFLIDKWIFWVLNCGNFIVNKTKMIEIAKEGANLDRKLLSIDAVVFSYLWLNSGNEIKIFEEFFHHHRKRSDSVSFIEKEDSLFATKYFIKAILDS